jgi:3-deoxy-D-manno-octulosonate 8-phosphate phosphatase (KDO 8-P phosphatase)
MKTGALLFAPAQYENLLSFPVKGVPFFLYSAVKIAGILGNDNVVIASDSGLIRKLAQQYGFASTALPVKDTDDPGKNSIIKELFAEPKDCLIAAFAGMPHVSKATILEGIAGIERNNDRIFTSCPVVEQNPGAMFSGRVGEKEMRLPFSFLCTKFEGTEASAITMGITASPMEAQVYTSVEHLAGFAESEDSLSFFRGLSQEILRLLHPHPIKMLLLDIDGVLTDGGMYYTESGDEFKKFDTRDGLAIKMLTKKRFDVGFISAGKNKNLIESRAKLLGVRHCYVGFEPKLGVLDTWLKELGFAYENVLYVGDDLVDLDIFNAGVLAACPADAVNAIKEKAKIILTAKGGMSCVRELIDNYPTAFNIS